MSNLKAKLDLEIEKLRKSFIDTLWAVENDIEKIQQDIFDDCHSNVDYDSNNNWYKILPHIHRGLLYSEDMDGCWEVEGELFIDENSFAENLREAQEAALDEYCQDLGFENYYDAKAGQTFPNSWLKLFNLTNDTYILQHEHYAMYVRVWLRENQNILLGTESND